VAGDRAVAAEPIERLANATGWPIIAEATSGLRRGKEAISTYDALLRVPTFAERHRPDLVIRIGKSGTSKALASYLDASVEQILLDPDGASLDPDRTITRIVRSDPAELCASVAARIGNRGPSSWTESWLRAERRARAAIDGVLDATPTPTEPRIARDLARALPAGAILIVASSMPVRDLDWFMEPRSELRVLANRGASGIDGFVSTALGVALGADRPVAALGGDLSMLHDSNGLALGRSEPLDAVFVVANNDGGGIFSFLPQAANPRGFEKLFGTPHGIDFSDLARLYECNHAPVEAAADLEKTIQESFDSGGVTLVEVRTDRAENVSLHHEIWNAVARVLESA
jgi:2-succinyl-5-enolpyruvyl-6-hydroxy-3-cyclohexene-1-carboxylate synthase